MKNVTFWTNIGNFEIAVRQLLIDFGKKYFGVLLWIPWWVEKFSKTVTMVTKVLLYGFHYLNILPPE